jgi:hypothetical protein
MGKTQEQNKSRLNEIIDNFIEQLKGEYKDLSAIISVNDGERTACLVHGDALGLMDNIDSIEVNKAYQEVKKTKALIDLIKKD